MSSLPVRPDLGTLPADPLYINHTLFVFARPNIRLYLLEGAQSRQVVIVPHSIVTGVLGVSGVNCESLLNKRPSYILKLDVKGAQDFS